MRKLTSRHTRNVSSVEDLDEGMAPTENEWTDNTCGTHITSTSHSEKAWLALISRHARCHSGHIERAKEDVEINLNMIAIMETEAATALSKAWQQNT
jgi:hypothetical protein